VHQRRARVAPELEAIGRCRPAIAITFFTAPPSSTPGRRRSNRCAARELSAAAVRRRRRASAMRSTIAVGWPRATSSAKLGPESAPPRRAGQALGDDLVRQAARRVSKPLHAQASVGLAGPRRACPSRAARRGGGDDRQLASAIAAASPLDAHRRGS
jgi:hypothetical protein